ncbi:hypothetical protein ACQCQT_15675, partial [Ralstonia pseudosolanacearum]
MTIIDLIGAAIGCGARDDGCKDGPRALLQAGAQQRLQTPDTHGGLVHGIELYTGLTPQTGKPNVLILMDNAAAWDA